MKPDPASSASSGHTHGAASAPALPPPDEKVYMGLPHERYLRPRFWAALAFSLPVLGLAMGGMVAPGLFHRFDARVLAWAQLLLTTPVFFWAGAPLNRRWWISIRDRDTMKQERVAVGKLPDLLHDALAWPW